MRTVLAVSLAAVLVATIAAGDDAADTEYLAGVMNQRLESQRTGAEVPWLNPSTGSSGIVVILETDDSDPERPCRTYRRTTELPGEAAIVVQGSACRIAQFLWQRSEAPVAPGLGGDPAAPVARAESEPTEPPPQFPPPPHKPDPNVFYASTPMPSVY